MEAAILAVTGSKPGSCPRRRLPGARGRGLRDADREEAAFRQELALAPLVIALGPWVGRCGLERAPLIAPVPLVPLVRLLSSAIDR